MDTSCTSGQLIKGKKQAHYSKNNGSLKNKARSDEAEGWHHSLGGGGNTFQRESPVNSYNKAASLLILISAPYILMPQCPASSEAVATIVLYWQNGHAQPAK